METEEIMVVLVPEFIEEQTLTEQEWNLICSRPSLTEAEWRCRNTTKLEKIAKKQRRTSETERLLKVFALWKK